ncbi:MAG: hypothetical protein RLZZ305_1589 [Actinomycetota bacterium]|jgi:hypothetical protein
MTTRRFAVARTTQVVVSLLIAAMWFYAFVLAPRESFNNVADARWSARSEKRCAQVREEISALAEVRRIDVNDPVELRKKADIIDKATDVLEAAVEAISQDPPSTEKGRALAPMWIADYRTYINDRRAYAGTLRSGRISEFSETQVEGVPISERLAKFARENRMRSCQPPRDLQA